MLLTYTVLCSSLLAVSGLAAARSSSSSGPVIDNRDVYIPLQRRLSSDILNPNITYVNQYSRPHTTGLTSDVAWDRYSLYIKGQRVFVYSGEFHPWRLPVPGLWRDVLQKLKAGGSNAVSIYTPWHMINPSEGVIDLEGINNYQAFFDIAKEIGIFVIARPGPFINGETSGGGIPGWVIRKEGAVRTNSTSYSESWPKYVDSITSLIARNEVSKGGPVIMVQVENEYSTGTYNNPQMEQLKQAFWRNGIQTPLTHNNPTGKGNWANGPGSVSVAAIDAYPAGFSCASPDNFAPLVAAFKLWSERVNRDAPYYFAEIQGGSFDPWGGNGYSDCQKMTNEEFERVQTQYLLENRVTLINKYMAFGGTNWGGLAAPVVYTSYDYGTYISEDRSLTTKYAQYKLLGLFLRNAPEIRQTEVVGYFGEFSQYTFKTQPYIGRPERNGTFYTTDAGLWTTELRNPDSLSAFYLLRQATWAPSISANFTRSTKLDIWTPDTGDISIPQFGGLITIGGRDSRIIPTDLIFGHTHLRYSTAAVLLSTALDEKHDLLVLYGEAGQTFEVVLAGLGSVQASIPTNGANVTAFANHGDHVLTFGNLAVGTQIEITIGSLTVVILDTATAYTAWQPTLAPAKKGHDKRSKRDATDERKQPKDPKGNNGGGYGGDESGQWADFFEIGTNSSTVVIGPYLVRNASLGGSELRLVGDTAKETQATIWAPSGVSSVSWNGEKVEAKKTAAGWSVTLPGPAATNISVPVLTNWTYADSLPEVNADFDDSAWVKADLLKSNAPQKPQNGSVVLFATDYGFVTGNILWRGRFSVKDVMGVSLDVTGGLGFAFSAYLNGHFLGSNSSILTASATATFDFPAGSLSDSTENVLVVVQDHQGLDQGNSAKNVRGITKAVLLGGTTVAEFDRWTVQGTLGGETKFRDRVRGIMNEGGLYGERLGWHLPGFDDSAWPKTSSLANDAPGVRFFRTTFDLSLPIGHDIPLAFDFGPLSKGKARALLFVNGWKYGKMVSDIGPQTLFPVPEGILDYSGPNTVVVALWSYGTDVEDLAPLSLEGLTLRLDSTGVVRGGTGKPGLMNPAWSKDDDRRT